MSDVVCGDCGQTVAHNIGEQHAWAALAKHTCPPKQPRRREPVMPTPKQSGRPPLVDLAAHTDKKVARAARKALDAVKAVDTAWGDYQAKAELYAERDRLKKQLAAVERRIKGPAGPDPKKVRAWAAANGVPCSTTGGIPKTVMESYRQAHGDGAA